MGRAKCGNCGQIIDANAKVCPYCRYDYSFAGAMRRFSGGMFGASFGMIGCGCLLAVIGGGLLILFIIVLSAGQ